MTKVREMLLAVFISAIIEASALVKMRPIRAAPKKYLEISTSEEVLVRRYLTEPNQSIVKMRSRTLLMLRANACGAFSSPLTFPATAETSALVKIRPTTTVTRKCLEKSARVLSFGPLNLNELIQSIVATRRSVLIVVLIISSKS